ncbi:hypothetical protein NHX12_034433 [Muraenolepis orangiensis]|uniref:Ras-GEF domain-containing protein n=1 Tax=Muraenolepis orangiensis TaxID=630683 RepID=A0A9Q0I4A9_9TELE|nr:hypothetical protein NHX12_034433 [Muraenolepis orangiensis]
MYQDPINPNTVYQDPINPNTVYQDPINPNTVYQDPINPNKVYQEPINPNPIYQEPIHQDPINHNNIYQDPINHNNIYQDPINHEHPIYHNPVCRDPVCQDPVAFLFPDVEGNSYAAVRRSALWPGRYRSRLMPGENRPLEAGLLRRVKEVLVEVEPRTAAQHITRADCTLRLDLLERYQTMAVVLALFILGCTGSPEERAALLHKAIQIAAQLKSSMGNMFGFSAVMRALELPQVARLQQTWTLLGQRYTEGAVLYQHTLRPFLKALDHGKGTSFPHVTPLLLLLEKRAAAGEGVWPAEGAESQVGEGEESWEKVEAGVDAVVAHLAVGRTIAQLGGLYCANAEAKLKGLREEAEVSEIFQTDFQTRLLWGSGGAAQDPVRRYAKYHRVLTTLSHHLEPPGPHTDPSPGATH